MPPAPPVAHVEVDPAAVPLDDMLINSLVKLAGGQKAGTVWPTHMKLKELQVTVTRAAHNR